MVWRIHADDINSDSAANEAGSFYSLPGKRQALLATSGKAWT
jgi:hypothetical protein